MRLLLLCVGKAKAGAERELAARYLDRAAATGRPLGFARLELRELDESRAHDADARKTAEGKAALAAAAGEIVAFDERGSLLGSRAFAHWLGARRDCGAAAATFLIGGADGLSDEARGATGLVLSFGPMTFPHQIARILAAEQIYRAMTILSGHPYHRD
ncbi:23S rRNA (pseudouridine(1915)-N(3))-methyltransferase RlmH [Methylocella sp.]|uniref:23S rRNA (pseudouridine(1915)-N(3))-methyltransferase RlmH n=1 Tax=Methylocella sp. TaxID=1978226 RepID=UPI0035B2DF5A